MFCSSWSYTVVRDIVPIEFGEGLNNVGGWLIGVVGLENEKYGPS